MKGSIIILFSLVSFGGSPPLSYYPLQSSEELMSMLFSNEHVRASSITNSELNTLDKIINVQFSNIGDSLQFADSQTADDYHYQLVAVLNSEDEKLVSVNAVNKSLPSWMLSNVSYELLMLKCAKRNQLFGFEVNLDNGLLYDLVDTDCDLWNRG